MITYAYIYNTHTHTHTHIYICVCIRKILSWVCVSAFVSTNGKSVAGSASGSGGNGEVLLHGGFATTTMALPSLSLCSNQSIHNRHYFSFSFYISREKVKKHFRERYEREPVRFL